MPPSEKHLTEYLFLTHQEAIGDGVTVRSIEGQMDSVGTQAVFNGKAGIVFETLGQEGALERTEITYTGGSSASTRLGFQEWGASVTCQVQNDWKDVGILVFPGETLRVDLHHEEGRITKEIERSGFPKIFAGHHGDTAREIRITEENAAAYARVLSRVYGAIHSKMSIGDTDLLKAVSWISDTVRTGLQTAVDKAPAWKSQEQAKHKDPRILRRAA